MEQCGLVTVSQAEEKCAGTFFQYSSTNGDCGCSTDDCAKSSAYDACGLRWVREKLSNEFQRAVPGPLGKLMRIQPLSTTVTQKLGSMWNQQSNIAWT